MEGRKDGRDWNLMERVGCRRRFGGEKEGRGETWCRGDSQESTSIFFFYVIFIHRSHQVPFPETLVIFFYVILLAHHFQKTKLK